MTKLANLGLGALGALALTSFDPQPLQAQQYASASALSRHTASGALDTTFSGDGKLLDLPNAVQETLEAVVIDNAGKIVVAGGARSVLGGPQFFFVARLLPNGNMDTTFSDDGVVLTDFSSRANEQINDMVIDNLGRIVVVGTADNEIALARYLPNGSLDMSFDLDGKVLTPFKSRDSAGGLAVTLDASNKIVVAGYATKGAKLEFALARYKTDGSLDDSFSGGRVLTSFPPSTRSLALDVKIDGNGKIVAAGGSESSTVPGRFTMAVARYNADGSLDNTFDGDGRRNVDFLSRDAEVASSLVIDSSNRIVIAGYADSNMALARLMPSGALDLAFSGDGKALVSVPGMTTAVAFDVMMQGNAIVMTGHGTYGAQNDRASFVAVRVNGAGNIDTSFGSNGIVVTSFAPPTTPIYSNMTVAHAGAIDSSGRLVSVGYGIPFYVVD